MPDEAAEATDLVVARHEEHASIHGAGEPAGWRDADHRDACLAPIGAVWTGARTPGPR